MPQSTRAAHILGPQGLFSQKVTDFRVREPQVALSELVESALDEPSVMIGEAGTGVGKTFAYLVPVIISGHKTVISTGTRYLQDQLFHQDLPKVCKVLGRYPDVALLKGRANYLCKTRLEAARNNPALQKPEWRKALEDVNRWASSTENGDIGECPSLHESSPFWQFVTSHDEHCGNHTSDEAKGCFLQKARRRAQEADIVVVNHHLLCADLALKEGGFGELLPESEVYVVDEAHQLPDIASQFFGQRLTSRKLLDLCREAIGEQLKDAPDRADLRGLAQDLQQALRQFRLSMGEEPSRDSWQPMLEQPTVQQALDELRQRLQALTDLLDQLAPRGRGLEQCQQRAKNLLLLIDRFLPKPLSNKAPKAPVLESASAALSQSGSTDPSEPIGQQAASSEPVKDVVWFETYRSGLALNLTPLDVAEPFQRALERVPASWVFVSATLDAGDNFAHFERQLGLESASKAQFDSPFDYPNNALLYLPSQVPMTQASNYTEAVVEAALPVIEAARGQTFFLFTSHRALNLAAARLKEDGRFAVFVQGDASKRELVQRFIEHGSGVLLGTASFWEGVDVRGDALSCVIIDKLPFAAPNDPVLKARCDAMRRDGDDPFLHYQVPQAIVSLKQGVGRLIRDFDDRGVLMLADPRLRKKAYGQTFLDALPPMRCTQQLDEVQRFFQPEA